MLDDTKSLASARRRVAILLPTLALLLIACSPPPSPPGPATPPTRISGVSPFRMQEPDAVMLVTGGTNGILEPCDCGRRMAGGLSRKIDLVRRYRGVFPRTFLLDTGDAFVPDRPVSVRNSYVIRGYQKLGYDALVLGNQEWAIANPMLGDILAEGSMAYLSTTVSSRDAPDLPLVGDIRRSWGGVRLAVVSDIHDVDFLFMPKAKRDELVFQPLEALAARVAELKSLGYAVVVSCHGDDLQLAETAKICDADLFLRGNTLESVPEVRRIAGKPVVQVGGDRHVGAIALDIEGGRIRDIELRIELVDDRWEIDQDLMEMYRAYMSDAMRAHLTAERTKGLAYVKSETCGRCHAAQVAAWRETSHGRAYATLVEKARAGDPDCLECHTTGFGTEAGFFSIEKTPELVDVGCQHCHEVELEWHLEGTRKPTPVSEDTCRRCHTDVTDPHWDYRKRLAALRCPSAR